VAGLERELRFASKVGLNVLVARAIPTVLISLINLSFSASRFRFAAAKSLVWRLTRVGLPFSFTLAEFACFVE